MTTEHIPQGLLRIPIPREDWKTYHMAREATVYEDDLDISPTRPHWAMPCQMRHNWDAWSPVFDQNQAVQVTSMAQAKMLALVHRWPHLLVVRCVYASCHFVITWWCDAQPIFGHRIEMRPYHFQDKGAIGRAYTLPYRYT